MLYRLPMLAFLGGLLILAGGSFGQEPKKDAKKDDPPPRLKGFLPANWGKIGLSDNQKQDIYRIQAKYNGEIDKLEAKIQSLKASRDKEMKEKLSAEQKKRLEDILTGKNK